MASRDARVHRSGEASAPQGATRQVDQVRAAEIRLIYDNAPTGTIVTLLIALLLAYSQWGVARRAVLLAWLSYMLFVAGARFVLVRRYRRADATDNAVDAWNAPFIVGTALASIGWAVAVMVLTTPAQPLNELFVLFAVGGVMLGGASLLAARPEAFVTFLVPTGLLTALRLAGAGDERHLLMALLTVVYTAAMVATTWRFHVAIEASLKLRHANHDLIESLQTAKAEADHLNRELELRVRDRTAALTDADRRKNEFLATLAHELRNPLAPIRFALETLRVDSTTAGAAHARDVIERQVNQLVRLVDDLLDVSRITANKIQLRREPLDVASLMATATESAAPLAAAAGQTLDVRPPAESVYVHGDSARLVQVFANVLNNAVKFTPRGGQILFTAEQQANDAVIRITDTGLGITADVLPKVFDLFHQADSVLERSAGGLGIGLTLARRLVEMHGGRIEVTSAGPGRGTDVEIRLPVTAAQPSTTTTDVAAVATKTPARTLRVLVVEDNVDAAAMLEMSVSHLGHVAEIVHDGAAAISAAVSFHPDVIFLDIGLPVINGYEVARRLRGIAALRDVHIAAVTGWGQDEDRRKAREAGCDSHFTKPLSPDALEELLATVAGQLEEGYPANHQQRTRLADSTPT